MRWLEPMWLWGILGAVCVGGLLGAAQRRALARTRRIDPRFFGRGLWRGSVLPAICLGSIAVALARPQWGYRRTVSAAPEADVAIVLDTSGSMLTRDVSPDRFSRAKLFLREMLRDAPARARVALVRVEGEGEVVCPLTLDLDALKNSLDELAPRGAETPGSDLGDGIRKATALLSARGARARSIVLLSDGEDLDDGLEAAVRDARLRGIVVHVVCSGTSGGGPVPARNGGLLSDEHGATVVSRADPAKMKALAASSGGVFLTSDSSPAALAARLRSSGAPNTAWANREPADRSAWPLALAIVAWSASQLPRREVS